MILGMTPIVAADEPAVEVEVLVVFTTGSFYPVWLSHTSVTMCWVLFACDFTKTV